MIFTLIYLVISFIVFFLGIFQIAGKNQLSTLNWYFFAICTVFAISTFNNSLLYYITLSEVSDLSESSLIIIKNLNLILTPVKIMIVPFLFAFILNLSGIKSKRIKILQLTLLSANALSIISIFVIFIAFADAMSILSSYWFNTLITLIVIITLGCLVFLQYKWIKIASLKRDRVQAKAISITSLISLISLIVLVIMPDLIIIGFIPYISLMALIFICNHYANQYNNFSFNISNLAAYVYTAVKLPVLILDDTGNIMLCNTASESFFKKNAEQLTKLKLFDLFDFGNISLSLQKQKKDASVFNCDAVCRVEGQKCQISLNYVYDKFDEIICTV
ncbi:hypothetical protein, partial [Treponema sp. R80B11-R83G3]